MTHKRVTRLAEGANRIDYSKMDLPLDDDDDVKEKKRINTNPKPRKPKIQPTQTKKSEYEMLREKNIMQRNLIFQKFQEQSKKVCLVCDFSQVGD